MSDPNAVVKYQERMAREAEQRAEAEAARVEAAKSPEQRASEAAAKVIADAQAERAAQKQRATEERREAAIVKASQGLDRLEWWQLCARWGREHRKQMGSPGAEAVYRRLKQENLINYADEMAVGVRQKRPDVGMSGCGAIAILGVHESSNVTTNAFGTRVQMVYRDRGVYVYTEGKPGDHNGVVTSVQY